MDPNDLILFDSTYADRLKIRRNLLADRTNQIIGLNNESDPRIALAVRELYTMLMEDYLPIRYPTIFRRETGDHGGVKNLVTEEVWPVQLPATTQPSTILEILPRNLDEDFFIMLPHTPPDQPSTVSDDDDATTYILEAYSACFPSGFQPSQKLGKVLAAIHDPVPGYKQKMEKSMDRYFRRLPASTFVQRANWSITVDEDLFSNFDKSDVTMKQQLASLEASELDLSQVCDSLRMKSIELHSRMSRLSYAANAKLFTDSLSLEPLFLRSTHIDTL